MIVSDLFDPAGWRAAVEELARKKYQVLVIHVLDEEEVEPRFLGDVALVDAEGKPRAPAVRGRGARAPVSGGARALFSRHRIRLREPGRDYLRTTTRVPFDEFILKSLRQLGAVS